MSDHDPCCLVLLAEDNCIVSMTLQDDLEGVGYAVAGPFSTCSAAMAWLQTATPHVGVLDVLLGDGPCRDLARELSDRGVPFVVYSASSEAHCPPEFNGATWIKKPAPHETLLDAVCVLRPRREQRHG